ncbi:MAG: DUF6259 domain-containing protein [Aristaeellaceae bacterium]
MSRRILYAALALLLCITGAAAAEERESGLTTLQNAAMTVTLDGHGRLVQLEHRQTGRRWLQETAGGYQLTVNTSTGDIWKTVRGDEVTLKAEDAAEVCCVRGEGSLTVTHVHPLQDAAITVTQTWTLTDSGLALDTAIDNACADAVVTEAVALDLKGLADAEEPLSLLWPDKEGALYASALQEGKSGPLKLTAGYPSPMSMQYLALYNRQESLYFAVHDPAREYKEFTFSASGGAAQIGCRQYPFVGAGQRRSLAPTCLALDEGGWYACADRYRAYLLDNGFCKESGQMARGFSGIACVCLSRYRDRREHVYTGGSGEHKDMAQLSRENKSRFGTDLMIVMGWHERGFDSRYPDYEFIAGDGGEEAFRQGVEEVHAQGGRVIPYINLHIADTMSRWYGEACGSGQTNGAACAILTKYQSVLHESYGTGLDYVAMCPMAQAWQDALVEAVRRLRRNGADGLWMDQLMEMPGNLCYNRAHGHTTPATAYAEGYGQLLARIDEAMREEEGDYFYCCEGVCDAYIGVIDICGLMWARLPGSDPAIAQQVTRYTMPCKFFGLPSAQGNADEAVRYAHAWTLADGMLCTVQNPVIKRYAALAERYPALYCDGRYMDARGLGELPEGVSGGVLISGDGTQAAIQLANTGARAAQATLTLEGYGAVMGMWNAESGAALEQDGEGWRATVPTRGVSAVLVQLAPSETGESEEH